MVQKVAEIVFKIFDIEATHTDEQKGNKKVSLQLTHGLIYVLTHIH